eukprot:TRINITY_DN3805_c0_g1_i1.p1 TRINITY_DN3805_c0_g1~~TRINITY_DN3805_c0_g1_i1.p1  ORF type:complete len:175 (+),score=16.29 TRINITY_DN3805_c0_g1_i1:411-935(+)
MARHTAEMHSPVASQQSSIDCHMASRQRTKENQPYATFFQEHHPHTVYKTSAMIPRPPTPSPIMYSLLDSLPLTLDVAAGAGVLVGIGAVVAPDDVRRSVGAGLTPSLRIFLEVEAVGANGPWVVRLSARPPRWPCAADRCGAALTQARTTVNAKNQARIVGCEAGEARAGGLF